MVTSSVGSLLKTQVSTENPLLRCDAYEKLGGSFGLDSIFPIMVDADEDEKPEASREVFRCK